jgi:hypothetical protein
MRPYEFATAVIAALLDLQWRYSLYGVQNMIMLIGEFSEMIRNRNIGKIRRKNVGENV